MDDTFLSDLFTQPEQELINVESHHVASTAVTGAPFGNATVRV